MSEFLVPMKSKRVKQDSTDESSPHSSSTTADASNTEKDGHNSSTVGDSHGIEESVSVEDHFEDLAIQEWDSETETKPYISPLTEDSGPPVLDTTEGRLKEFLHITSSESIASTEDSLKKAHTILNEAIKKSQLYLEKGFGDISKTGSTTTEEKPVSYAINPLYAASTEDIQLDLAEALSKTDSTTTEEKPVSYAINPLYAASTEDIQLDLAEALSKTDSTTTEEKPVSYAINPLYAASTEDIQLDLAEALSRTDSTTTEEKPVRFAINPLYAASTEDIQLDLAEALSRTDSTTTEEKPVSYAINPLYAASTEDIQLDVAEALLKTDSTTTEEKPITGSCNIKPSWTALTEDIQLGLAGAPKTDSTSTEKIPMHRVHPMDYPLLKRFVELGGDEATGVETIIRLRAMLEQKRSLTKLTQKLRELQRCKEESRRACKYARRILKRKGKKRNASHAARLECIRAEWVEALSQLKEMKNQLLQ